MWVICQRFFGFLYDPAFNCLPGIQSSAWPGSHKSCWVWLGSGQAGPGHVLGLRWPLARAVVSQAVAWGWLYIDDRVTTTSTGSARDE